jgi:hypothetical protein
MAGSVLCPLTQPDTQANPKRANYPPHQDDFRHILKFSQKKLAGININRPIFVSEYSLTKIIYKMNGKNNIAIGFLTMGLFMAYGFLLIYLRDFAPGKEEWVNSYSIGKAF